MLYPSPYNSLILPPQPSRPTLLPPPSAPCPPPPHTHTFCHTHTRAHTHTVIWENAFFSHNTKISMLSHTSICQVPLVSQLFHFAPWIHTLCLVMIKSLKWMALGPAADNLHPRTVVGVPLLQMLTLTLLLCCNACFFQGTVQMEVNLLNKCYVRPASVSVD